MVDRPNWSRTQRSDEQHAKSRRGFLAGGVTAAVLGLAGCLDESLATADDSDSKDAAPDEEHMDTTNGDATATRTDALFGDLRGVVDDYIDAAAAEDVDALANVVHSASILHPARWAGSDWEFDGGVYRAVDGFELADVTTDVSVELLFEYRGIDLWFDRDALGTRLGSEEIVVVDVGSEPLEADQKDSWILVTEDGEWRVFFVGSDERATGSTRESFAAPIVDEEHDVVESVTWDVERESSETDSDVAGDRIQVRVALTDSPGVEADTVRIETTVADAELEFYTEQNGPISTSWAGNTGTIPAAADGEQLVVTAVDGDEETVVHREHYTHRTDDA